MLTLNLKIQTDYFVLLLHLLNIRVTPCIIIRGLDSNKISKIKNN